MRGHQVSRKAAAKKKVKSRVARIPKRIPPPPVQFAQPIAIERISDWDRQVQETFELMRLKINTLEAQVAKLRSVISVENNDVSIHSNGSLNIFAWRNVEIYGDQGLDVSGGSFMRLQTWGDMMIGSEDTAKMEMNASTIDLNSSTIDLNASYCEAEGAISCVTLTASDSVISSNYAPGKGNQW
jgi:hypothetical protein